MTFDNTYVQVIAICIIIILSYLFGLFSKKTNVPSVLLLILFGIGIKFLLEKLGVSNKFDLTDMLELLGIVGLIMIVLEAALDLKLNKDKLPLIIRSFFIALIALGACIFSIGWILNTYVISDYFTSLVYAIPLSIMSSAIIIPSVANLVESKKEFMIYESTFSDILGIMVFYFFIENDTVSKASKVVGGVSANIGITIGLSILIGFALVILLQSIDQKVKLFLLIAVLVLLYSVGKLFHLSSLIVILIFGLILSNHRLFFRGKLDKLVNAEKLSIVLEDFHIVTMESAFVVRTFFFVIFGMTLDLSTLVDIETAFISGGIVISIYIIRFILFKLFRMRNILPEVLIAPRGLITILLFFSIPAKYFQDHFNTGILLYTILLTSIIMTISMMAKSDETEYIAELNFDNWESLDEEIEQAENKINKESVPKEI